VEGKRNLIMTPSTKHCQAGVGHLWDQVWGESSGEDGAGEEEETPESPAAIEVARWGRRPYLGLGATGLTSWALEVAVSSSREEFDEEW
jgi:hypothetical protein